MVRRVGSSLVKEEVTTIWQEVRPVVANRLFVRLSATASLAAPASLVTAETSPRHLLDYWSSESPRFTPGQGEFIQNVLYNLAALVAGHQMGRAPVLPDT